MKVPHSSNRGSALVAMILVLACTAMVAGTVARITLGQSNHAQKTVHRMQAQQAAQAGSEYAKWRLSLVYGKSTYGVDDITFTEARSVGITASFEVRVKPYGGYTEVVSVGLCGREVASVRVLLGVGQPRWFSRALTLHPSPMPLTLTSRSKIVGDVGVSQQNVRMGRIPGTPVPAGKPNLHGRIDADPIWPVYRRVGLQATINQLEQYIGVLLAGTAPTISVRSGNRYSLQELQDESTNGIVFLSAGFVQIESGEGPGFLRGPLTIVSAGEIHLLGRMEVTSGVVVAAGNLIRLSGDCTVRGGILYSTERIELTEKSTLEGQAISHGRIDVLSSARVRFPGVLYTVATEDSTVDRGIRISSTAEQSGSIVSLSGNGRPLRVSMAGPIVLDGKTEFTGLIYGEGAVDLNGYITGSVAARILQFEHRETTYINWLRDVVLDRTVLKNGFMLPSGFHSKVAMEMISWTRK